MGNPEAASYDLIKNSALSAKVLLFDNHGSIGTKVVKTGLNTEGIKLTTTSNEEELVKLLSGVNELWIISCWR